MSLLVRIAIVWIILGLIVGFILRRQLGAQRLGLVYSLSLLPWLSHMAYIIFYALERSGDLGTEIIIFAVSSAVLALVGFWSGRRFAWAQPSRLSLVPIGIALIYAVPLIWFRIALRAQSIGMDAIPTAVLVGATLFVSSVLAVFTVGLRRRGFSPGRLLQRRGEE